MTHFHTISIFFIFSNELFGYFDSRFGWLIQMYNKFSWHYYNFTLNSKFSQKYLYKNWDNALKFEYEQKLIIIFHLIGNWIKYFQTYIIRYKVRQSKEIISRNRFRWWLSLNKLKTNNIYLNQWWIHVWNVIVSWQLCSEWWKGRWIIIGSLIVACGWRTIGNKQKRKQKNKN